MITMKKRHFLIVFVLVGALLLLPACGGLDQTIWTPDPPVVLPPPPPPPPPAQGETVALAFMPGVYTGVGEGGFGGNVYVEVTVNDDGFIESIVVTEHRETQAFMSMVEMSIVSAIIHSQSTDVDIFAGATDSSNALIAAVADALEGAEGEEVVLTPEPEEPALAFNPGVFSGVGEGGFGGNVYVDVTVNEFGQIVDITVTSHRETQAFMSMVEMNIVAAIIHSQSTDVDVFSGATESSNALIAAVVDALAGAGG
jgi:uncharacterized protein with FMN-binding domain